ncbi:MAG TPA: adenylate/guanylate cyclase domain-containing protein [Actinomycetota bacterium]|jgi:class 3 adenylate cyclase|nr:adenylate/guanylate cyclase domain-containing protein [Actinomycetota bacterium]
MPRIAFPGLSSLPQRLQHMPIPVIDAGLAVSLAAAITIAIRVSPEPGARRGAPAYLLGWMIAALVLARRRWPLAVLLASAVILQLYYQLDYPGIYPAVPLSVGLATAWAAGHRLWSLLVVGCFVAAGVGVGYKALAPDEPALRVLGDVTRYTVLFAAVLLLGEAVRTRRALQREEERSQRLLLNVLPAPIAARLKQHEDVIADGFPEVTVLFADLVDFTRRSQASGPEQLVQVLDELFSAFDMLARRHGLEKIKTIGDAYMVAGGLPEPRPDHAQAVAEMALALREESARHRDPAGRPLALRIGIDTGPVVAGVIGTDKFSYDLWGDAVNTASRMESTGVPGCIQVTARTYQRLRDGYRFERRGLVAVKGKGEMVTWFLVGRAR